MPGVILEIYPTPVPPPLPEDLGTPQQWILVARLRMATDPSIVIGYSPTEGNLTSLTRAVVQPTIPLSATDSYMLDAVFEKYGKPITGIKWDNPLVMAPVIAAQVNILSASLDATATTLTASLEYGITSVPTGARVNVYSFSGGTYINIGSNQTQANVITVPVNRKSNPPVYFLSSQAVISTTNVGDSGAFIEPFSLGPPTTITDLSGIPQAAKSISYATYNGKTLMVGWDLDTQPGAVAPGSSRVQILSHGEVINTFSGGPASAIIPLEVYGRTLTVQVNTVANNLNSAPISFNLITEAPTVTNVTTTKQAGKVTASVATVPTGLGVQAFLMDGSKVLAGPVTASNGEVSFDANVSGLVGVNIIAQATDPGNVQIVGPQSQGAVLLATAPAIKSAVIYTNSANTAQWKIYLDWDRLPDAAGNITSYTVSLEQNGSTLASQTTSGTWASVTIDKSAIVANQSQTIKFFATGITGGVSPSQALSAVFTPPTLKTLTASRNQLVVDWEAPSIPAGDPMPVSFRAVVFANNTQVYRGSETRAYSTAVPLANVPAGNIVVMVECALGPVALLPDPGMPAGSSATPILTSPFIDAATADPLTNISTLNWSAVGGGTNGYIVNFSTGTSQDSNTNSLKLTQAQQPGTQLGYTVQAKGISNGVALVGPPSEMAFVPTNVTTISWIRFDGSNVSMAWSAVDDATGYNVFVFDDANVQAYSGSTTQTSIQFAVPAGKTYSAYVQPQIINGTALRAATATPLFSGGIFVSQQPSTTASPYTYISQSLAALGSSTTNPPAQTVVLYLPEICAKPGDLGSNAITIPPFTIETSGQSALPYKLTIANSPIAWTFNTAAIRTQLQTNYVNFLKAVEKPSQTLAGATPYGISLVQAAIACALPQTFTELLYYNFGFNTSANVGAGCIDLRPGMILRVVSSDYYNTGQTQPPYLNGFSGAHFQDYEIGSYASGQNWITGFDAFLNMLAAQGMLTVSPPTAQSYSQSAMAAAVDLYYPQFVRPFYRLYFPSSITNPQGPGSNSTQLNFTLVSAAKYAELQSSTVNPANYNTAYFRGRTIVHVMIRILVNGCERVVPVGTTLGNLLEQLGLRPSTVSPVFNQLRLFRSVLGAITSTNPLETMAPKLEVKLNWSGFPVYATGNGLNATSVPLLPGDEIITDKTGS